MNSNTLLSTALAFLLTAPTTWALVNPSLQPIHLYERYNVVLAATVMSAELTDEDYDVESGRIKLKVTAVCRGEFKSKEVTIDVPAWDDRDEPSHDANDEWNIWDVAVEGRTFVAFVGKIGRRGRGEDEILLYCGERQSGNGIMRKLPTSKNHRTGLTRRPASRSWSARSMAMRRGLPT